MEKTKIVLSVFGEGGHESQMNRLMLNIAPNIEKPILTLTDSQKRYSWSDKTYSFPEIRSKHNKDYFGMLYRLIEQIRILYTLSRSYKVDHVISTGPGCSIIVSIYFKLFSKAKILHVETWSRFYSKSMTGKIMYILADAFYIQNEELKELYPKSIYSGRL